MTNLINIGTISTRGQIAIPSDIRNHLGLEEGSKVLFFVEDDSLLMKKVTEQSFAELTKPLHKMEKKIKESQVNDLIHKIRKHENRP